MKNVGASVSWYLCPSARHEPGGQACELCWPFVCLQPGIRTGLRVGRLGSKRLISVVFGEKSSGMRLTDAHVTRKLRYPCAYCWAVVLVEQSVWYWSSSLSFGTIPMWFLPDLAGLPVPVSRALGTAEGKCFWLQPKNLSASIRDKTYRISVPEDWTNKITLPCLPWESQPQCRKFSCGEDWSQDFSLGEVVAVFSDLQGSSGKKSLLV